MNLNCTTSSPVKISPCSSGNYNKCKCVDYEKPIAKDISKLVSNIPVIVRICILCLALTCSFVYLISTFRQPQGLKDTRIRRMEAEGMEASETLCRSDKETGRKMFTRRDQLFLISASFVRFSRIISTSIRNNSYFYRIRLSVKNDSNNQKVS